MCYSRHRETHPLPHSEIARRPARPRTRPLPAARRKKDCLQARRARGGVAVSGVGGGEVKFRVTLTIDDEARRGIAWRKDHRKAAREPQWKANRGSVIWELRKL